MTDGLVLRPWRRSDAATVRATFGCPDSQRWHVRRLDSLDEAGEWITQWADRWDSETAASWAVVDGDDRPLGQVGLRFRLIGFNRLNVHHSTANTASCRVAERSGYRLEGTLRRAIKHADGWHDWHIHSRLRTDS